MEVFVRILIVLSFLSAFLLISMIGGQQGRRIPPGIREADKLSNKPLDTAIAAMPSAPDPAKLKREADELAQLSAGVPSDLARVAKGQLPKDLADKLKRIEKLAKNLRNELSR
jgi:hypothetical protein